MQTGQGIGSNNMFAYCMNNPVMLFDPSGNIPIYLLVSAAKVGASIGVVAAAKKTTSQPKTTTKTKTTPKKLTADQKVLVATIAGEGMWTANKNKVSTQARQAMANVAVNRIGKKEWSQLKTVSDVCAFSGFDAYGDENYLACMNYLNARDGSHEFYEQVINEVIPIYLGEVPDITGGCQLYYTPASMEEGKTPRWDFSALTEVTIPGVDPYYEGRFYKYK